MTNRTHGQRYDEISARLDAAYEERRKHPMSHRDWEADHAVVAAAAAESIRQHQAPYTGKHRGEQHA